MAVHTHVQTKEAMRKRRVLALFPRKWRVLGPSFMQWISEKDVRRRSIRAPRSQIARSRLVIPRNALAKSAPLEPLRASVIHLRRRS